MDFSLRQRGRATFEFLVDLRLASNALEPLADESARSNGVSVEDLPVEPEALQSAVLPVMQQSREFRVLRTCREWMLDQHGQLAMDAFEELRDDLAPQLDELDDGPTTITIAEGYTEPEYWTGVEFHRSAGGWDGHDYMGFVHGQLIHRKMIGETFAGAIYQQRKDAAASATDTAPEKILELGCASGQYTQGIADAWPDAELWACDVSLKQLEQTRRRANEQGLEWHLLQADAAATGLDAGGFDLVTSYAMFHELPSSAALDVLKEAHRLLKPGGRLHIADVTAYHVLDNFERWRADYWNQVRGGDPFWREYASTDLAALAKEAGFADAQWEPAGPNNYPFVLTATKEAS